MYLLIFVICVYCLQLLFHQHGKPRGIYRGCTNWCRLPICLNY